MIGFDMYFDNEEILKELSEMEDQSGLLLINVLEVVGFDTISFLRSLTPNMRPPARAGEGERAAHPGNWADITSNLANAYRFEVTAGGRKVRWSEEGGDQQVMVGGVVPAKVTGPYELHLLNDMEYAAYLEAKEGYFVISGVTQPGGPVDTTLRRVAGAVPGWRIEG